MTKIVPSAFIGSISGKHNGSVFRRGKNGLNLANKAKPPQSPSNSRSAVKARFSSVANSWSALTAAQVAGWNSLAKDMKGSNVFGDKFTYSGIAIFQRLNNNLINSGTAPLTDAPTLGAVGVWTTFTPSVVHDGAVSIIFAVTPVPASTSVIIEATAAIKVGRQVRESDFRQIMVEATAGTSPITATTAYQTKFGTKYAAGKNVYFRAYQINTTTGQAGQPLQAVALIS
jgi:hypothetical protein